MKRENNRDRKRGYCESLFSPDSLNFLKLKNFPKTKVQNSCRENAKRYYCCAFLFFLSANIWRFRGMNTFEEEGRGGKKNEKKQGTWKDGWNQYVPDYKERVDVIERQQKSRKAMVTRNDWLSGISNKKPRKYVRKEARFISVDISI